MNLRLRLLCVLSVLWVPSPAAAALDYSPGSFSGAFSALSGVSALTVLARIRTDTLEGGTNNVRYAISLNDATAETTIFYIRLQTADDTLRFGGGGSSFTGVTSSTTVASGTLYSVAGVYGSSTLTIYIDGDPVGSAAGNATTGSHGTLVIGKDFATAGRDWDGTIEEVALYDAALTDAEVAAYHQGLSPLLIRPQSLVCYQPAIREEQPIKGPTLTKAGTVTAAPHGRIYR